MHHLSQDLFLAFNYDFTTCTTKFYKRKMGFFLETPFYYYLQSLQSDFNFGKISMNRDKMGSFLYFINSLFYRKKWDFEFKIFVMRFQSRMRFSNDIHRV